MGGERHGRRWLIACMAWTLVLGTAAGQGAPASDAAGGPTMHWLMLDLPPGSMPVNEHPSDGMSDRVLERVMDEMPQYRHSVGVVGAARALLSLADGDRACFASAALTPQREQVAYFTPTYVLPAMRVVVRADKAQEVPLNEHGEVSMRELLRSKVLHGIVVKERSYSPSIDEQVRLIGADAGVRSVPASGGGTNLLKMLELDRADYTLEYDFVLTYQAKVLPVLLDPAHFVVLPIAGAEPVRVGIACPHTPWGRDMIRRIDAIVARVSKEPGYRSNVERWLTPAAAKRHKHLLDQFLAQRAEPLPESYFPAAPPWPPLPPMGSASARQPDGGGPGRP